MPIVLQERVEPWFNSIKAHVEAHVIPQAPLDPLELQPLNMFSGPLSTGKASRRAVATCP